MTTMNIFRYRAAIRSISRLGPALPLRHGVAAAVLGAALGWGLPAQAQWFERPPGFNTPEPYSYDRAPPVFRGNTRPLPPDLIVERLEDRGFEDVGRPRYNGSTYEVDATSPRGLRVRIVFDAFRGAELERYALGRGPEEGRPAAANPQRGWFGNNVRPPEEAPVPRRYSNRPPEEDDGPDTFERLSRPADRRLAPGPQVEVGPPLASLPAAPPASGRAVEPGLTPPPLGQAPARTSARPREVPASPERTAARPEAAPDLGKVEGVNPSATRPATRAPQNERAAKPENNRQFEAARTDPAARKPATRPASEGAAVPILPAAPAPVVAAPATPSADKPAVTAESVRPEKPVRVIGGVTPMNPDGAEPKTP